MPAARRHPIGLRLEQTLPGSATRAATVLGLRRQYGCFWITLWAGAAEPPSTHGVDLLVAAWRGSAHPRMAWIYCLRW